MKNLTAAERIELEDLLVDWLESGRSDDLLGDIVHGLVDNSISDEGLAFLDSCVDDAPQAAQFVEAIRDEIQRRHDAATSGYEEAMAKYEGYLSRRG